MPEELATVEDLALYQAADPALLVTAAEALVRAYCGWHIAPSRAETITVFDGLTGSVLMLPTLRLTELTSVTIGDTVTDLTQLEWSESGIVRWTADYWPASWWWDLAPWSAVVEMTHGYETVPADVNAVVLSIAARAAQSPNGVVRRQVGLVSETASQSAFNVAGGVTLLKFERVVLDRYRIPLLS